MLSASDHEAFRLAVKNNRTGMLDSLWKKAVSLEMESKMLSTNNYTQF